MNSNFPGTCILYSNLLRTSSNLGTHAVDVRVYMMSNYKPAIKKTLQGNFAAHTDRPFLPVSLRSMQLIFMLRVLPVGIKMVDELFS